MATLNYIYIGSVSNPSFYFDNESLLDVNANIATSMIEDEFKIDTLEFSVNYEDTDDSLKNLNYGTPIYYYVESNAVGVFYFKSIRRYGNNYYDIDAVSFVGLLEYETFYGGMYTNKNLKDLFSSIIMSDGLHRSLVKYQYADTIYTDSRVDSPVIGSITSNLVTQQSSFYIMFRVLSSTDSSTSQILYSTNVSHGSQTFELSISTLKYSNTSAVVIIECGINQSGSQGQFVVSFDDIVMLRIDPTSGLIRYSLNFGQMQQISFTPVSTSPLIYFPANSMFGSTGDSRTSQYSPAKISAKFAIYYCSWSYNGGSVFYGYPVYDFSSGTTHFYDEISTNSVSTDLFRVGGDIIPATGQSIASTSMLNILSSVIWNDNADNINVNGWLPICSKREAVHRLLFALNLNVIKSNSGELIIGKLLNEVDSEIDNEDIYNSGSVELVKQPLTISVTEYSYNADISSQVVVFDNSDETAIPTGEYTIQFSNAPIYGTPTASSGMTIVNYNANTAVVTGKGSITSYVYKQNRKDIVRTIGDRADGGEISVTNDTLITALNSSAVMDKLVAYYGGNVYRIKNSILEGGQRCGRKYSLQTPFGEDTEAFLTSSSLITSSIAKLNCEFVSGFVPVDIGNKYNNYVVLTGSGTFEVPSEVFSKENPRIYVVLIGGGQGGASGYAGEDGTSCGDYYGSTSVAHGGNYGENGSGGLIYSVEIDNPSASYSFACGSGGEGGALCSDNRSNNKGTAGDASTFGTYSSASGKASDIGYTNILNGEIYGYVMPAWNSSSGKGGNGEYATVDSSKTITRYATQVIYNLMTGYRSMGVWNGDDRYAGTAGTGGGTISHAGSGSSSSSSARTILELAGGHGGAAFDVMAADPGGAYNEHYRKEFYVIGSNGATPTYIPPKATTYNSRYFGYGGMGGAGGGGGGNGGAYTDTLDPEEDKVYSFPGGTGGQGGKGGTGGDGCIVIYY